MNFKPTTKKVLTSIIIGPILGLLSAEFGILQPEGNCSSGICVDYGLSLLLPLIIFVVSSLVVYSIWSLATKN